LIELVPRDMTDERITASLARLKSRLEGQGITCTRLSEDEIWHLIKDRSVDRFTKATNSFIGRCRQRSWSSQELRDRIDRHSPSSAVEKMFLNLAHDFYVAYVERLSTTGEEDFNRLMQRAAEAIDTGQTVFTRKSGSGDLAKLRYICIDEFQDFSDLFYRLLKAIRKHNSKIELFCVGDDWQAITGFAGSDLRFFRNFEESIEKSRTLYLSTHYRSSNAIVGVGNALMAGLGKPAIAYKQISGKVFVADLNTFEPTSVESERHGSDVITPAVLRFVSKGLTDDLDVVMLCRQNALPWPVNYLDQPVGKKKSLESYRDLVQSFFPKDRVKRISFSTVHKYKGLEKSTVTVLDAIACR